MNYMRTTNSNYAAHLHTTNELNGHHGLIEKHIVKISVEFTVGKMAISCQDMYRYFLREPVKTISHGKIEKSKVVLLMAA